MPTPRTWTDHGGLCRFCDRFFRASQEAIDDFRKSQPEASTMTDEEVGEAFDICLSCADGEEHEGEHDLAGNQPDEERSESVIQTLPPAGSAL